MIADSTTIMAVLLKPRVFDLLIRIHQEGVRLFCFDRTSIIEGLLQSASDLIARRVHVVHQTLLLHFQIIIKPGEGRRLIFLPANGVGP